jgi:hypothetical protein
MPNTAVPGVPHYPSRRCRRRRCGLAEPSKWPTFRRCHRAKAETTRNRWIREYRSCRRSAGRLWVERCTRPSRALDARQRKTYDRTRDAIWRYYQGLKKYLEPGDNGPQAEHYILELSSGSLTRFEPNSSRLGSNPPDSRRNQLTLFSKPHSPGINSTTAPMPCLLPHASPLRRPRGY